MNFIFISPNFPRIYSHFVKSLHDRGVNVLGIGDEPYDQLSQELKENLTEYCYVSNMSNLDWMKNTVDYLKGKYGQIDYIESNNEFWLFSDSYLREHINCPNGFRPDEMNKIKYKSQMKEYFEKAGVKTARYILSGDLEKSLEFVKKVGYPVFAKPDDGVGAASTFKIKNIEDLKSFHEVTQGQNYIIEEYIDGFITSFDGICDDDSNVVLAFNETFPTPIAEVVNKKTDVYYYAKAEMPKDFYEMGCRVVKSFGIKKRCFHIEFFKLNNNKEGLGKKGDIVAIEVNMRSPGGNTPDLLCLALNGSYYDVYADTIAFNKSDISKYNDKYISISVNKKYDFQYAHTHEEISSKYNDSIKERGCYPKDFRDAMGDEFYFARFKTLEEALEFEKFVHEKK